MSSDGGTRARRFWFWDPSHFPRPVSAAAESLDLPAMAAGFGSAAAELRRPLAGQRVRTVRGYVYFGIDLPATAAVLAERERSYAQTVSPRLATARSDWSDRYAPEAEALTRDIRRLAAPTRADADLARGLDEAVVLRSRQWAVHDLALVPAMEAAARFNNRYAERLGGVRVAQTLLQGFPNRATATAEALDLLAERIRARDPAASAWLDPAAFASRPPWFAPLLDEFLAEHGARASAWDLGDPTWSEDPRPALSLLRGRLRGAAVQPGAERRAAANRREVSTAEAVSRLAPEDRPAFLSALAMAQGYPVISEDHNTLIDQQGMAALRSVVLAVGARLVAHGVLGSPADAVCLTKTELQAALIRPRPLYRLVSARRQTSRRRALTPPKPTLGAPLPAWAATNVTLRDFFGLGGEPVSEHDTLTGHAVSGGTVEGRACIVRSLDEIDALEEGDILVCPMTSPAWTPWLGMIGGAVVETGGLLSHTAILAREYGIPCVVRAHDATRLIPPGALIRVDGATGTVTWRA